MFYRCEYPKSLLTKFLLLMTWYINNETFIYIFQVIINDKITIYSSGPKYSLYKLAKNRHLDFIPGN